MNADYILAYLHASEDWNGQKHSFSLVKIRGRVCHQDAHSKVEVGQQK